MTTSSSEVRASCSTRATRASPRHRRRAHRARPGFGFGKTLAHNLALLRAFRGSPRRVIRCSRACRARLAGQITGRGPEERLAASLAAALAAVARGAGIVRVHDVRDTVDALAVWRAIEHGA
jgi:dihydropteroate synthase